MGVGISNQRETSLAWDRSTGEPLGQAIVWQCARAVDICERVERAGQAEVVRSRTGINLSPYFPASKIAWILENVEGAKEKADSGNICHGTIDTWLIYKLTGGKEYKTDYSNASRTQLFNIFELKWDQEICELLGSTRIIWQRYVIQIPALAKRILTDFCLIRFRYTEFWEIHTEPYLDRDV